MSNKNEYKKYLLMRIDLNTRTRNGESDADFNEPVPDIRESFRKVLDEIADNAHILYGNTTIDGIAAFAAEDIAEYIDHIGKYLEKNNPYHSERKLYERCRQFDSNIFAQHWDRLHPYLRKRYETDELNIQFYADEFTLSCSDEYPAVQKEFMFDWDVALLRKEIAYEIEILSRVRREIEKNVEERLKTFYCGGSMTATEVGLFWGLQKGSWQPHQINLIRALAAACRKNSSITELLDQLGRKGDSNTTMEIGYRETIKPAATIFSHAAPPDIDGVTESNRLNGLLPSELALLGENALEMTFYKKYTEHRLQTFDSRSHICIRERIEQPVISTDKKGPYIVCLDTSGSMSGKPEEVSKAICYGLLLRSREEMRSCYLISFSVGIEVLDLTDWDNNFDAVAEFLIHSFDGGTDLEPALDEALKMLEKDDYLLADVLVVSDFIVGDLSSRAVRQISQLQARNVQFHSLLIGSHGNQSVLELFDRNWVYNHNSQKIKEECNRSKRNG